MIAGLNLRPATYVAAEYESGIRRDNTLVIRAFIGIKASGKWSVEIQVNGERILLRWIVRPLQADGSGALVNATPCPHIMDGSREQRGIMRPMLLREPNRLRK